MVGLYETVKFFHVLLAILAVGANATYGIWIERSLKNPQHLAHVLRGIRTLDVYLANPAYLVLLLTGLWLVDLGGWGFTSSWIQVALGLYVLLVAFGVAYSPTLRKQIAALETEGAESETFQGLSKRGMILGIVLGFLALAIVFVMVAKPTFW